jgi:carbon monoxide dehydrogenase subunit G
MAGLSLSKQIDAPIESVFDVATDLAHAAEHIRGIKKIELLTPGPVALGTRWRETRKMMGHESTETLEITAFNRPRHYTVGCNSCGCYFESTFSFVPEGNTTKVTIDLRAEARTFFAKLMSPLGKLMLGKTMRKCLEDDLDDLKRVAESRARANSAANV